VKRLKDVAVARREFDAHMDALGKVEHRNVLPVRAYYFSKDEKLLVFDYLPNGSLSAMLHGSRGSGKTPLDWDARMRSALSAARGLAHLHMVHSLVHGNVKSSNVLLRPDADAAAGEGLELAQFAAGCFWSVELTYQRLPGVARTEVGYSQGHRHEPTYRDVCGGGTG
ncbi:peptide-methionine (S)-S-oxide reductase, partial [Ectobacillus sp. SYSU M60031]|nr:peptide-methionine (S)-S-oxide reductase [Ectobacillus ponti]